MAAFARILCLAFLPLFAGCTSVQTDLAVPGSKYFDIKTGAAIIHVRIDGELILIASAIYRWISDGTKAVEAYFGQFPVTGLRIQVFEATRTGVHGGTSFGYPLPYIRLNVGPATTPDQFLRDWTLTHELVHLAFPALSDEQVWAQEGLATYVEPLARYQAGQLGAQKVWMDMVEGLPHGIRELRRAGLDENGSWGCTYWGGAAYWLFADIEIRKRSGNRRGLQHALKAILASGGHSGVTWPVRKALGTGDRSLDAPVLVELYERMRAGPQLIDLEHLWRELGVRVENGKVMFDDTAVLAAIRKAIAG